MKKPIDYFNQGVCARDDNLPISANPLRFKAWPFDAWEMGWHYADLVANAKTEDAAQFDYPPDAPVDCYDQGKVAAIKGIAIEDCPYGDIDRNHKRQWRAGWTYQNASMFTPEYCGEARRWAAIAYTALVLSGVGVAFLVWLGYFA